MKIETIILIIAIISTGLMAGIFFTWSNAVTPGIGKLNDLEYLKALQAMNQAILNTPFRILFMVAVTTVTLVFVINFKSYNTSLFYLLLSAFLCYGIGSFGVTFLRNIPLNRLLEETDLELISKLDATTLRTIIETKWNFFNWVRTLSSLTSFILLIVFMVTEKN